ncbi:MULTISPECIES: aldehyde dehydrogenase [unclassified Methanoregula]|uniref:aldehyde dehydrogenase family protein n=1 Tax=unclassified Methanoregula TaxID=2649730 RepID=UPI0009CE339E|nr:MULTISPECIES: aldehyde dehydrogenase family protein [unclassified Methanoregula]OPX65020.1 MAG: Lactaldehyde dehydrogenase [Methanoregula sp. PtaB.Bin085]OPY32376.1 MAG: Lactaldehyde dehydrogenase [Methanoregula sp. PtaU1.Bin006]
MKMRIGGKEVAPADDVWIDVINPATGELIDRVPAGSAGDVADAVSSAAEAFDGWKKKGMRERGMILFHAAEIVRERHKDLARLLTMEQGKPLREAIDEVRGYANILEFYAGISAQPSGDAVRLGASGDALVVREPVGVCGAIIPWNMPVLIMGWKTGPALLAGNTLVIKPASSTPLTSLTLAAILDEAGLPPGVLNMVTGRGGDVGEALVRNPGIKKISFTGNCTTGERIRELASSHLRDLTLELGGSDPMIVMDDADIDKAVEGALRGRFYNAGQTCTAVKRLYVHDRIAKEFIAKLKTRTDALNVGNGLGPKTDIGPLNSAEQQERIARAVERTRERGEGTVLTGGGIVRGKAYETGHFYHPTLVTDVAPDSCLVTEEIFGPVLPVMSVPDLNTAIACANASRYGLGASVWTKNISTVKKVFDEVQAGIIWVNRHLTVPPEVPFGGTRESGIGRENGYHALDQYSRTKTLFLGW